MMGTTCWGTWWRRGFDRIFNWSSWRGTRATRQAPAILTECLGEDDTVTGTVSQMIAALLLGPNGGNAGEVTGNHRMRQWRRKKQEASPTAKSLWILGVCRSTVRLLPTVCRRNHVHQSCWVLGMVFYIFRDNCPRGCHCGCHNAIASSCKYLQ